MTKGFNQPQIENENPTFNQIGKAMREIKELKKLLEEKEKALTEMNKRNQILVNANIETRNRFSCLVTPTEETDNMDTEAGRNTTKAMPKEETSSKKKRGIEPEQDRAEQVKKVREDDGTFTSTQGQNEKEGRPRPINIYN